MSGAVVAAMERVLDTCCAQPLRDAFGKHSDKTLYLTSLARIIPDIMHDVVRSYSVTSSDLAHLVLGGQSGGEEGRSPGIM